MKKRLMVESGLGGRKRAGVWALLAVSLIWLGPALACGSFQPRPTPVPSPVVLEAAGQPAQAEATPTPMLIIEPTATPVPLPTATFTPTPIPGTALVVGEPARIAASGGLNLRQSPSTGGTIVARLGVGQRVTVVEGPVSAEGYTWWRLDDGQGNVGWGAQGDGVDEWITPKVGEPQPVNRSPRVGDRVRVTMEAGQQLSIRALPGVNSPLVARADVGEEFTVLAGPQSADDFFWYQIRSDDGEVEGWAADGIEGSRWLSPLE